MALVLGMSIHGLSVARALASAGIEVYCLDSNPNAPPGRTKLAHVFTVDGINSDGLPDILRNFRSSLPAGREAVLFPTSDNMVSSIGMQWDSLKDSYRMSWGTCADQVLTMINKANLTAMCEASGIHYPRSVVLNSTDDISAGVGAIGFPMLVKPLKPLSRFKAVTLWHRQDLDALFAAYESELPYLAQTWIEGETSELYFCTMLLRQGEVVCSFTGRKVRAVPAGTGMGTIVESVENEDVRELSLRFLDGLNLSGPVAVEFKRDHEGRYWMIEPNAGRTEYSVGMIVEYGINLPLIEYYTALGIDAAPQSRSRTPIVWIDTERDPWSYAQLCWKEQRPFRSTGKRAVLPYFGHDDPAPFRASLLDLANRGLRKLKLPQLKTRSPLERVVISRVQTIGDLPPVALEHLAELGQENLFLGPEWFQNYELTVGRFEGQPEWNCIFSRRGELLGVWPMVRMGQHRRILHAMGNYYSPYMSLPWFAPVETSWPLFFDALTQLSEGVDCIEVLPVAPDDTLFAMLKARGRPFTGTVSDVTSTNWFQHLESAESYLNSRPTRLRNTLRRKRKRLEAEGFEFTMTTSNEGLDSALEDYFTIYSNSWKRDEPYPDFIRELARTAAASGWLRLGIVRLGGRPAAAQLWMVQNKVASIYKLAHDEQFYKSSVGTVLSWMMVEHVSNQDGVTRLDYLTGDDAYKQAWMDNSRDLYRLEFHNPRRIRGLAGYMRATLSRLLSPNQP